MPNLEGLIRCYNAQPLDYGAQWMGHACFLPHSLALACCRYTGADLAALVRQAAIAALEEDLATQHVAASHFQQALQVCTVLLLVLMLADCLERARQLV